MIRIACTLAAMVGITAIELYALKKGINGKTLALAVALISGLGGFVLADAL